MAWCESWSQSPFWNIILLALAWALTLSTSTLLTTVGPLSADELGASKSLSAFTIGIFLIGAAVSSVPSGWLFRRYGRFWGFTLGCLFQLIGSALGALALATKEISWLYLGCFSVGLAQGLGQFYRFTAVEVTPPHLKSRAVTYVLSGGIIAAFLGPSSANYTIDMVSEKYIGSYLMVSVFAVLNQVVIMLVNFPPHNANSVSQKEAQRGSVTSISAVEAHALASSEGEAEQAEAAAIRTEHKGEDDDKIRSSWEIATDPQFALSCTIATLAHTIMVMLMSNVTVNMNDNDYSFSVCSLVMELHFFAMFAPGFVSGKLIEKYGSFFVAMVGGFIFAGSSVVFAVGSELWNYIFGMILLGVAWNLAFSAGTVMLTGCYKPQEATEVQAINDFVLFTVAGGGSLLSGMVYADLGWLMLIYVSSGLMFVYLLLFAWALGRVTSVDEAQEPLIQSKDPIYAAGAQRVRQIQREDHLFDDERHHNYNERSKSFSEQIFDGARTVSVSLRADPTGDFVDDQTPLRAISVA